MLKSKSYVLHLWNAKKCFNSSLRAFCSFAALTKQRKMPSIGCYVDIPFWVIQSIQWYISNSTFTCHTSINIPHLYSIHGFPWGRICTNLTINVSLNVPVSLFFFPICWWPKKFRLFFWCPVAGNWTVSTPSTDHSWAIRWSKVISGTPTPQSISMLRTNLSPHRWDHAFYPFFFTVFLLPSNEKTFLLSWASSWVSSIQYTHQYWSIKHIYK